MSITKNGVSFNKTAIEKLNKPLYAIPMLDRLRNRFAIVGVDYEVDDARKFYQKGRDTSQGVRWTNNDLITTLESIGGWDIAHVGMKVKGRYDEEERAIIFDLDKAEPIEVSKIRKEARWEHRI